MGVALTSCTVPAAGKPTFELGKTRWNWASGSMASPAANGVPLAPAAEIAEMLVEPVLADLPFSNGRQGDRVRQRPGRHAAHRALCHVQRGGPDPAGARRAGGAVTGRVPTSPHSTWPAASVTLLKVDDELLRALGRSGAHARLRWGDLMSDDDHRATEVLDELAPEFRRNSSPRTRTSLTDLDAAIGDGDHGANMDRGMRAVVVALDEAKPATAAALFSKVGMTLVSTVGGASGPLFGTLFLRMGASLGDSIEVSLTQLAARCGPAWTASSRAARPKPGTRPCTTRWLRQSTRSKRLPPPGRPKAEALRLALAAAEAGPGRDDADACPQRSRELSRRAQRRAPGPRRLAHRPRCCPMARGLGVMRCHARPWRRPLGRDLDHADGGTGGWCRSTAGRWPERRCRWRRRCCTTARCGSRMAAGLDETTLGTDAVAIKEAIEQVDGPAGVVVLMDLGSAVLSTELALDLLYDHTTRDRVLLSPAPMVEGLVVAAVAAAGGADRFEVAAEARGALLGKAAHLIDTDESNDVAEPTNADVSAVFTVTNKHGLHARPAARLVGELRGLDATVTLRNVTTGAGPVSGSSLSRVATLAVLCGHEVEVSASGPQAHDAVEHLVALARRRFDEPDEVSAAQVQGAPDVATAGPRPASPGIAIGPARMLTPPAIPEPAQDNDASHDPDVQWRRVVEAIASVRRDVERLRGLAAREIGATDAGIFDAHLMLLGDTSILADVKAAIVGGATATAAWRSTVAAVEAEWAALPDPYLRARAADVRAIGDDVLRAMTGSPRATITECGILVAPDLTPADAAQLDRDLIIGIVLAHGSPSSHAAILARSRGNPAIVGAGAEVLGVRDGIVLALDGSSGELAIDPDADTLARFQTRVAAQAQARARDLAMANEPAVTRDGVHVEIAANIGSVGDARAALRAAPMLRAWYAPSFSSSVETTRRPSLSKKRSTSRSPRRSVAVASPCARSMSAAISRCLMSTRRPKTIPFSDAAASGLPSKSTYCSSSNSTPSAGPLAQHRPASCFRWCRPCRSCSMPSRFCATQPGLMGRRTTCASG